PDSITGETTAPTPRLDVKELLGAGAVATVSARSPAASVPGSTGAGGSPGVSCGGPSRNVKGSDAMPLATTSTEYVPGWIPAGSVNWVVTGRSPVATPVLLQLKVRA